MKNAEEKAKRLIQSEIEEAELAGFIPGTVETLLEIADPEDLVELGHAEYLKEFLHEYEGNMTKELEAAIHEALKKA